MVMQLSNKQGATGSKAVGNLQSVQSALGTGSLFPIYPC
jgi:hypothetical protein